MNALDKKIDITYLIKHLKKEIELKTLREIADDVGFPFVARCVVPGGIQTAIKYMPGDEIRVIGEIGKDRLSEENTWDNVWAEPDVAVAANLKRWTLCFKN
jgi:hypothetical protein